MALSLPRISSGAACLGVLALAISAPLFSQNADTIVDNAKVRVLRETVNAGETVATDHHELDRLIVFLQQGSESALSFVGMTLESAGSSDWAKLYAPRTAIVIELKRKGNAPYAVTSPQNPWLVDPKHYGLYFENNDVRVTRVNIGPKESTPLHEHSLNRVVIYLTPMDFQIDPEGKPSEHSVQKAGAIVWGNPVRHTEHNLGDQPFEAVVIEPKY